MRPVPWHVKGVHPDARDVAREAARRSGVSVGTWLNSLIIKAADERLPLGKLDASAPHDAGPVRNPRPATPDDRVAVIGRQIDELKWRIDSLSRDDSARHAAASAAAEEMRSARLAEAIARIDRQLERLNGNRRAAPAARSETAGQGVGDRKTDEGGAAGRSAGGGGAAGGDPGVDAALAEITARQHALDDEFAQPQLFDAPAADPADKRTDERPAANAAIEQQLADIATQIKALQGSMHFDSLAADLTRTVEQASPKRSIEAVEEQLRRLASETEAARAFAPPEHLNLLRDDIADIGRRIADAMPPQAVAAIEQQVRSLTEEVERLRPPLSAAEIADALRKDFAAVGNALEETVPRQAGATIEEQMRMLTAEIGKLFPPVRAEEIAAALRKDLAEIADTLKNALPEGALASLEQEVRALGARIEANRESLARSSRDRRHRAQPRRPARPARRHEPARRHREPRRDGQGALAQGRYDRVPGRRPRGAAPAR